MQFEGQSFVPNGNPRKEYWLGLTDETRKRLIELLVPLGWHEFEEFQIEFYGMLSWVGDGCGHLGVFGGTAHIDHIVSVFFQPPDPRSEAGPPLGIRGVLERHRARLRGSQNE